MMVCLKNEKASRATAILSPKQKAATDRLLPFIEASVTITS
jgi:hypothetical protein